MLKYDEDLQQALAECFLSTKAMCTTFFPERFDRPFAAVSDVIFRILDDDNIRQAVLAAPRGYGKSSIVNMAYPAKKIVFREKKFIVPISCTATQAVMRGEDLKNELLMNELISKTLFGPLKSETFAKDMWITSSGIAVMPRGAGQQVRGILHRGNRPDLILVDDLEDSESVRNEEQRKKLREWFFADVVNSIDRAKKNYKIIVIGTVLHEDSLLVNLLNDPEWTPLWTDRDEPNPHIIELCDDSYRSNWPEYMTDAEVRTLAEGYALKGLLHVFAMEYRNTVISADSAFRQEFFKYYEESDYDLNASKDIENVVIVDPAKTTNMRSAYSAVVGIGLDMKNNRIYVRDVVNERLHPDELYETAFAMCGRLRAHVLGVEVTGLNEFITHPFRTWITKKGLGLELIELKARGGSNPNSKEDRVRALVPFYRQGLIYHNKTVSAPLESQLIAYPRSKYWDVMDCFAYVVEMMALGERYMYPEDMKDVEDEYDILDNEPAFEGWRIA
jgi:hypothetical protein